MRISVILILVIAVFATAEPLSACEMIRFPPTSHDPERTALTGVVREHLWSKIPAGAKTPTHGFAVEVTEADSVVSPGELVRVFPLATGLDCEPVPRDREDVEREYPIGAVVSLVGKIQMNPSPLVMSWAGSLGSVARRPTDMSRMQNGCLDFRQFKEAYAEASGAYSGDLAWRTFHLLAYEDFEFFSCLGLLELPTDPSSRDDSFVNLSYYSAYKRIRHKHARESFSTLLKNYGVSMRERRRIMKRVLRRKAA